MASAAEDDGVASEASVRESVGGSNPAPDPEPSIPEPPDLAATNPEAKRPEVQPPPKAQPPTGTAAAQGSETQRSFSTVGQMSSVSMGEETQGGNEVIGIVPRYAMPNISSLLPNYANSEQEFIHRTFHTGNYDYLKHLPDTLKGQQVMATRTARMEAARQFLMPAASGPYLKSDKDNQQGLFQAFEYMPSRLSLADELASKERAESEAKRMAIGGKDFTPAGSGAAPLKHQDFQKGKLYPYMAGPYEAATDAEQAQKWLHEGRALGPAPFVQAGTDKLADKPTKAMSWEMMSNLRKWVVQDWEGADVQIFENDQDCWVTRIDLSTVDSQDGLMAYMNVFIRCNELINSYKLTKVVEFWNTAPGDGCVYFVMRPPWVRPDRLEVFFALFPLEREWQTSAGVLEVQRTQPLKDPLDEKYPPNSMASSGLRFDSRLNWGTNFMTGTPAPAPLGKMFGGGLPTKQ